MRAKKVQVEVRKISTSRIGIEYTCPKCHIHFWLCRGIDPKVTVRFLCSECGQEIIADYVLCRNHKQKE